MKQCLHALAVGIFAVSGIRSDANLSDDYLAPIDVRSQGRISADYRKLYESKLFVTSGDVARYVHLGSLFGNEFAVSVYRDPRRSGGLPGGFWVTSTEASERLWKYVRKSDSARSQDARSVHVKRRAAPLPESTAHAVRAIWLAMLTSTRPPPDNGVEGDTDQLLFSAVDATGTVLRGRAHNLEGDGWALVGIAFDLYSFANMPESMRPKMARKIEKAALRLLRRASKRG